jgi:thiamine biosynthesis lipoprotein
VQTAGAFDVTVAPLVEAWGFGRGRPDGPAPTPAELAGLLRHVGSDRFELRDADRAFRRLDAAVRIDLAGIVPGYAVDRISEALAGLGLGDHVVELGGEVRCRGRGPGGRAWRVAIERPDASTREAQVVVELRDLGISTSGDYRDFRVVNGRRLSHTIDPRTGRPVEHALASVSVVHPSVMMADAYATALMVLGPEQGLELARRMALAALFVSREGDRLVEHGTPSFLQLQAGAAPLPATAHN